MNERVLEFLNYLKTLRSFEGSTHSVNAIDRAISKIEKLDFNLICGQQGRDLFPGIVGEKISYYIDQILKNTGSVSGIKDLDNIPIQTKEKIKTVTDLIKVQGIGIVKALEYFDMGIRSIEDLNKYNIEHNNETLTTRQTIGIRYHDEFNRRIPREKITIFADNFYIEVRRFNNEHKTNIQFNVMGSFIRGALTSGDIDILLYSETPNEILRYSILFVNKLESLHLLKDRLSSGIDSYQGVGYIDNDFQSVRVDIKFVNSQEEFPYSFLYFVGSRKFNEYIRSVAHNMGYKLGNNEMLDRNNQRIIVRDESEIFRILGIEYKNPEQRNI
jgi:DNA polymerase beta